MDLKYLASTMGDLLITGVPVSILVLVGTMVVSIPLGFLLGLARFKKIPVLTQLSTILLSLFRGTPLIVLIFILYSAFPDLLNSYVRNRGWDINVYDILLGNPIVYAIFICCTFTIANLSEVFRAALSTVQNGQLEAALSVGLTPFQAYIHVIIPQAVLSALPDLGNNVISLLKGTSLLFYMGLKDIMGMAKTRAGESYFYIESYFDVLIVYIILCLLIQKGFDVLEKHMGRYLTHRRTS